MRLFPVYRRITSIYLFYSAADPSSAHLFVLHLDCFLLPFKFSIDVRCHTLESNRSFITLLSVYLTMILWNRFSSRLTQRLYNQISSFILKGVYLLVKYYNLRLSLLRVCSWNSFVIVIFVLKLNKNSVSRFINKKGNLEKIFWVEKILRRW